MIWKKNIKQKKIKGMTLIQTTIKRRKRLKAKLKNQQKKIKVKLKKQRKKELDKIQKQWIINKLMKTNSSK